VAATDGQIANARQRAATIMIALPTKPLELSSIPEWGLAMGLGILVVQLGHARGQLMMAALELGG
jgi:hypothetical protein